MIVTAQVGDKAKIFKEDQSIEVKTQGGKTFKGQATKVVGSELTISIDSSQRGLRPGAQTLVILVKGQEKLDGVSAQVNILKEKFALLDENGTGKDKTTSKDKRVPVETGLQNDTEVIIKSGLIEGDRVILPPPKSEERSQWGRS